MPQAHYLNDGCPGGHQNEVEEMFQPWTGNSPAPKPERKVMLEMIQFLDGGLGIQYMTTTDSRGGGSLIASHSLAIQATPDYARRIEKVRTAVLALLDDALEDFEALPADVDSTESDEDDDDD